MMRNIKVIVREVLEYVDDYVAYCKGDSGHISDEEYRRRYRFTTLRYFHDILGICQYNKNDSSLKL